MPGWNESSLFAMLFAVALKSTVVLGAAWLLVVLLRGQSAATRHFVWTAAATAVLALPVLSVSLPALRVAAPVALVPRTAVFFHTAAIPNADVPAARIPQRAQVTIPAPWRPDWRLSLMLIWMLGSVAAFSQMLVACAGMWRVRRAARLSPHRQLSTAVARDLGIRREVEVLETDRETMPMTFGILRPAVFLPSDAAEWSEERRRIVLLHELAHVRRGDVATHLLARLAVILHWWNPLAWTAWRGFLKERERATDDVVLQAGARASDYATHLLEVARSLQVAPATGCVAVAMARPSQLEGRLVAILDSRANRKTPGHYSVLAATLAPLAIIAPLAAVRAQERASQAVPSDVDATIRAASAQRNPEMLEKPAAAFEALRQYDSARKLLDSAAAIRQAVSGSQSVAYGIGLLKIADLERKRNHPEEAQAFYRKALQLLGDRLETAPALMYLGMQSTDASEASDYIRRAKQLDPSLSVQTTAQQIEPPQAQQPAQQSETRPNYVLEPIDQILIRAFEVEELNAKPFRLDEDGMINLPLIGKVKAGGMSVQDLEAKIVRLLKTYVKNPSVTISIISFRTEVVFFAGAFQRPGIFPLQGRRTLLEMLTIAGGLAPNASRRIKVTRRPDNGPIPLPNAVVSPETNVSEVEISMGSLRENFNAAENIVLMPFDRITVERAEMIYIQGEVEKVGSLELGERESISVRQLLNMAGGLSKQADSEKVRILRPVLDTPRRAEIPINVKKILAGEENDLPVLPNDILVVPRQKTTPWLR